MKLILNAWIIIIITFLLSGGSFSLIVGSSEINSTVTNSGTSGYELLIDGQGQYSIKPIATRTYVGTSNYSPMRWDDGEILIGRGGEYQLYISVVPRINQVVEHRCETLPSYVRIRIRFENAFPISLENNLMFFNWPQKDASAEMIPSRHWPAYDWVEVDTYIMTDPERVMPTHAFLSDAPTWWRERYMAVNLMTYFPNNYDETFPRPVYDVLTIDNSSDVLLEAYASVGTDSFIINFNVTQHPASVKIIPLMDHPAAGVSKTLYVGRGYRDRGTEFSFNERIPLTMYAPAYRGIPGPMPVHGYSPGFPSPIPIGVGLVTSAVVSITGMATGIGIVSAMLSIILSTQARPQVVRGRRRRQSRKKTAILRQARQVSKDPALTIINSQSKDNTSNSSSFYDRGTNGKRNTS